MPKLIPGIYNYCDRWCERCPFTSQCRSFRMEKAILRQMRSGKTRPSPKEFWSNFDLPYDRVEVRKETARELRSHRRLRNEPLGKRSLDYGRKVMAWLRARPEGAPADAVLADAMEVIAWYHLFIGVKLQRAVNSGGRIDVEDDAELVAAIDEADRDDERGSAKVALIAIDRSIAAWRHFAAAGDNGAEPFIQQLGALCAVAEQVFPTARQFIRPGLDW